MTNTLLFDAYGNSVPPGAQSLDALDLRAWPGCRVVCAAEAEWDGTPDLVVILGDGAAPLSPDALAQAVAVAERGGAVVLHARDDDAALRAVVSVFEWLGGAHA